MNDMKKMWTHSPVPLWMPSLWEESRLSPTGLCFFRFSIWRCQPTQPGAHLRVNELCVKPSKCLVLDPGRVQRVMVWGHWESGPFALSNLHAGCLLKVAMVIRLTKSFRWIIPNIHKNINVVRGPRAQQPGEMSPFFACDSLVVMRRPSCKPLWAGVTPWRGFARQDTLKLPLGNLETEGDLEATPTNALLPWVVPELGAFSGSVSVCRSLRAEAVTGTRELNLGSTWWDSKSASRESR